MKTSITFLLILVGYSSMAQTTAIPDPNFEQALIDQGIDSDGTLNGQVLTADIVSISNLDVAYKGIEDLTGIEGFSALINLNVSYNFLDTINLSNNANLKIFQCNDVYGLTSLNLSGNPLLEELYCNDSEDDAPPFMFVNSIDLSNNPNIQIIELHNLYVSGLSTINLKTDTNNTMTGLLIDIDWDGGPHPAPKNTSNGVCIQIDDETAATQNQFPYSTWTIDHGNSSYFFSENCSLGIETANLESILYYPNPVRDFLTIANAGNSLEKVNLYNLQGKIVKSVYKNTSRIDLRQLASGVYFLELYGSLGNEIIKIIKE